MKRLILIAVVLACSVPATAQLLITGVFDGPVGGHPRGVELFACDEITDLGIYGIRWANEAEGVTSPIYHFPIGQTIPAGSYLYVSSRYTQFNTFFGFGPDLLGGGAMDFSGDDAIELVIHATETVVDVYGDRTTDGAGQVWEFTDGWAKRHVETGPDGNSFDVGAWNYSGTNIWAGAATNVSAPVPFPLEGFYCDPTVATENRSFDSIKSLYR